MLLLMYRTSGRFFSCPVEFPLSFFLSYWFVGCFWMFFCWFCRFCWFCLSVLLVLFVGFVGFGGFDGLLVCWFVGFVGFVWFSGTRIQASRMLLLAKQD